MIFTSPKNQTKIVSLMNLIDDMHRRLDMSMSQADQIELAVAFMIRHLLDNNGGNVVMSYGMANALYRVSNTPYKQYSVRLTRGDIVITSVYLTQSMKKEFIVMHPDGSSVVYDEFETLLRIEVPSLPWSMLEYIAYPFTYPYRWLDSYKWAQTWSKNIINHIWLGYYGEVDFIFNKLKPAATKFIDDTVEVSELGTILDLINSLN